MITDDFKRINDGLSGAAATDRERALIISSLAMLDERHVNTLSSFIASSPTAAQIFLENYRKKYTAQLRNDSALWNEVIKEEDSYLESLPD